MVDLKVRDSVKLISPKGDEFNPLWAGGTRSVKKRLAMYSYAGINGQVVDDYGCESVTYPLNIIFTGDDHRQKAKEFFEAFQQPGKWEVVHPTEGSLGLQGVEATETDDPIKEGGVIRIETQWIEYIDPVSLKTLRNALIEMGIAVNELEEESLLSAVDKIEENAAGLEEARKAGVSTFDAIVQGYNRAQYAAQEAVDKVEDFKNKINTAITSVAAFVKTVQDAINAPARFIADIKQRIKTLKGIVDDLFGEDKDPIEPNRNNAIIKEVVVTSVLASIAEGVVRSTEGEESGLQSRSQLLATIEAYDLFVEEIVTNLDRLATQSAEAQVTVEPANVYIPFESTSTVVKDIIAKTRNALLDQFFELPTESRIIVRKPTTIYDLAREYYGTTGRIDEILTKIEENNGFTSTQILLIPAGTTVTVYG
jgi:prophage DNA circulation protein